jgi:hypothetical protein
MGKMAGMLDQHYNITDATWCISQKTRSNRIVETVEFFPQKIILPFPSSHDLETQAAADLTHSLLHPQPACPFCQVGDEDAIALKRLASIFASAKPQNTNNPLAPQYKQKIMHLRGCKPQFHLRGWQAQTQNRLPSNSSHHHNQHQIRIAGKRHLSDE